VTNKNDYDLPQFSYGDTADFISAASGVLFVGPELLRFKEDSNSIDESLTYYVRRKLSEQYSSDIEFFHPTEHLFMFKSLTQRTKIKLRMTQLYSEIWDNPLFWDLNKKTLSLLAELPFHLIVTVTSDNFIFKAFEEYGLKPKSSYFIGGEGKIEDLVLPTKDKPPLIYNLCGSIENNNSLILDYNELFTYLKSVLNRSRLPTNLDKALEDASIFIFLGFEMHRWQTQLLLQLIQEIVKDKHKFASQYKFGDEDFFKRHFKIADIGDQQSILNELRLTFGKEKLPLRPLKEIPKTLLDLIAQMVIANDFEKALNELKKHAQDKEDIKALMVLESSLHHFRENETALYQSDAEVKRNILRNQILKIAQTILQENDKV
jgi:SIR2-like domain